MKKFGFTLAEVLITLGIIGVVASLTIPTLIENYQKEQTVEKLKKIISEMAQMVKRSELDNGSSENWDWGTNLSMKETFETYFASYLKVLKYCSTYLECQYPSSYFTRITGTKQYFATNVSIHQSVLLSDGTLLFLRSESVWDKTERVVFVDINGPKLPNFYGKDIFVFEIDKNKGFLPYHYYKNEDTIKADCSFGGSGALCAAKIMRDGWQIKDDYPWN